MKRNAPSTMRRRSRLWAVLLLASFAVGLLGIAPAGATAPATTTLPPAVPDQAPAAATGANATDDKSAPSTETVPDTAAEPTDSATPGERLDSFLGDLEAFGNALGEQAQQWGDQLSENIESWQERWDWDSIVDGDWNMFGKYHIAGRTVIHDGYYTGRYILHLRYDTSMRLDAGDKLLLEQPSVIVPEAWQALADDADFAGELQNAVDALVEKYPDEPIPDGYLRLISVDGPYTESADTLLERFYTDDTPGPFTAVLASGRTTAPQRELLLHQAAQDQRVAYLYILLEEGMPATVVDPLLQQAYDDDVITVFYLLLPHASQEARQSLKDQATRDRRFTYAIGDEDPSPEAIDAMLDTMDSLSPAALAIVSSYMTPQQALTAASIAYDQDNIAAFTVVMGRLSQEDIASFNARAREDQKAAFLAVTGW